MNKKQTEIISTLERHKGKFLLFNDSIFIIEGHFVEKRKRKVFGEVSSLAVRGFVFCDRTNQMKSVVWEEQTNPKQFHNFFSNEHIEECLQKWQSIKNTLTACNLELIQSTE